MANDKNILAENMRRFGTKNLNEQTINSIELEKILLINFLKFKFPTNQNKIAVWMRNYNSIDDTFYYMGLDPIFKKMYPESQLIWEDYKDWLQQNGFQPGDIYVDNDSAARVQQQILAKGFK